MADEWILKPFFEIISMKIILHSGVFFSSPINQNFQLARLRRKEVVNIFIHFQNHFIRWKNVSSILRPFLSDSSYPEVWR